MDIDLTPRLVAKMNKKRPRTRGRYSASDVYSILAGYMSPEDWMYGSPKDAKSCIAMSKGSSIHAFIQEILGGRDYKEQKVEKYIPELGITLVGMADWLEPDEGWEFKSSVDTMQKAKPGHKMQAKLYCTMFERPRFRVFQPLEWTPADSTDHKFWLKELGVETRDDEWFKATMLKLSKFHLKLEDLWNIPKSNQQLTGGLF